MKYLTQIPRHKIMPRNKLLIYVHYILERGASDIYIWVSLCARKLPRKQNSKFYLCTHKPNRSCTSAIPRSLRIFYLSYILCYSEERSVPRIKIIERRNSLCELDDEKRLNNDGACEIRCSVLRGRECRCSSGEEDRLPANSQSWTFRVN